MQRPYICNSENRPNENEATTKKNKQRAKPKAISKTTLFRNAITKAKTVLQDFVGQFSFLFFFPGYRAHRLPVTMGCPPFLSPTETKKRTNESQRNVRYIRTKVSAKLSFLNEMQYGISVKISCISRTRNDGMLPFFLERGRSENDKRKFPLLKDAPLQ